MLLIHFVMNLEGGYAFLHGRHRNFRTLAEAKQDDGHGSPQPKGLLAGDTATTREPKAWSWDNGSFHHYFPRYPQFLARQDKPDASSGCNSRPGKG